MIPYELIEQLEAALSSPWALLFLGTWVLGWFLKEQVNIPNRLIPVALLAWGIFLGLMLIELSIGGGIIGAVMAAVQMGAYDIAKPALDNFRRKE